MIVRTRIAPSPTGDPHLGTAYIALFNWIFAKKHSGSFILRIEDTDRARSSDGSEKAILDSLRWLGLDWDEGPDCGGAYGPYRQSERKEIYLGYAEQMVASGKAFKCFCTANRLNQVRREQQSRKETSRYDGHCLGLTGRDVELKVSDGEPHVIRMVVPREGDCIFQDLLRGEISIPYFQVDMQILIKTDGMPTYHLAVVVDDHLMGITHVIRGEEWISSVPKYKLLCEYLSWEMPTLLHLPLLRNPDQSKLSKRKNPTSVNFYKDSGFLPEALVNYLCLMGWTMPDQKEIFSLDDMVEQFDVAGISTGGPIFDQKKLSWLNGQYIRNLSDEEFVVSVVNQIADPEKLRVLAPLLKERVEKLTDIIEKVDYIMGERRFLNQADFEFDGVSTDTVVRILFMTNKAVEEISVWNRDAIFEVLQSVSASLELKLKQCLQPLFVAISGKSVSLPLFDSMEVLGKDLSLARIRNAMDCLEISGKMKKKLEKEFGSNKE